MNNYKEISPFMLSALRTLASSFDHAPGVERVCMLGNRQTVRALEVRGYVAVQPCWRAASGSPALDALVQLTEDGASTIEMSLCRIADQVDPR